MVQLKIHIPGCGVNVPTFQGSPFLICVQSCQSDSAMGSILPMATPITNSLVFLLRRNHQLGIILPATSDALHPPRPGSIRIDEGGNGAADSP